MPSDSLITQCKQIEEYICKDSLTEKILIAVITAVIVAIITWVVKGRLENKKAKAEITNILLGLKAKKHEYENELSEKLNKATALAAELGGMLGVSSINKIIEKREELAKIISCDIMRLYSQLIEFSVPLLNKDEVEKYLQTKVIVDYGRVKQWVVDIINCNQFISGCGVARLTISEYNFNEVYSIIEQVKKKATKELLKAQIKIIADALK